MNLPHMPLTIVLTSEMPSSISRCATNTSWAALKRAVILLREGVTLVDMAVQKPLGRLFQGAMRTLETFDVIPEVVIEVDLGAEDLVASLPRTSDR